MLRSIKSGLCVLFLFCALAPAADAQVSVSIGIGVPVAPPSPPAEVIPGPPGAGLVWAPGYWAWFDGRYIWVAGRYIAVQPGAFWVPDHWEHRGQGWYRVPGRWENDRFRGREHEREFAKPGVRAGQRRGRG